MTIIVTREGKDPKRIGESKFEDEDKLQNYIYNIPESIPLYEIKEDIKLLILAREFPTSSGPVDAIGIDQNGEIYLIETKLYKNPDKRLVVAQVLDYGAAISNDYRDFDSFIKILEEKLSQDFGSFSKKICDFFGITNEEATTLIENLKRNVISGNFKFVVLMDKLHDQLKNLIIFINQNSQFNIYAVELEYYKFENFELTIPKIFGSEIKKSALVQNASTRKKWDEKSFFDHTKTLLNKEKLNSVRELYEFSKISSELSWGTGSATGSFNAIFDKISSRSLYSVYSDGRLILNFHWLHDNTSTERFRDNFKEKLSKIPGILIPHDYQEKFVRLSIDEWYDKANNIVNCIKELLSEIN